jgi:signal transduction histidine kinase
MDSMRTGGRLILRMRDCPLWRTGTKGVRITVADTGHGMSAEVRARIFEAFYSTKGSNGNGLGLWISKGIVEKHHASLQVESSNRAPAHRLGIQLVAAARFHASNLIALRPNGHARIYGRYRCLYAFVVT